MGHVNTYLLQNRNVQ